MESELSAIVNLSLRNNPSMQHYMNYSCLKHSLKHLSRKTRLTRECRKISNLIQLSTLGMLRLLRITIAESSDYTEYDFFRRIGSEDTPELRASAAL